MTFSETELLENRSYLELLSGLYPSIQAASTEIIRLQAILNLPKGTEHFISDIHGEYEAFTHILRNASGSVKRKINQSIGSMVTETEKNFLATLIYYPERKLAEAQAAGLTDREWYLKILRQLVAVCRVATSKYTRSKVQKALPPEFEYVIGELINTQDTVFDKEEYFQEILNAIVEVEQADEFIAALCHLIHRMVIDKLHIIGDIYDRGDGSVAIMDGLSRHHNVDFQWGNHDILWMGAAAGQTSCIANVIRICFRYNNGSVLEEDYGINLRPLAVFAVEQYADDPCLRFLPKKLPEEPAGYTHEDMVAAWVHKAIAVIQFKLEGQMMRAHPEYRMTGRNLLEQIDFQTGTVLVDGKEYPLNDRSFPTVDPADPCALTEREQEVIEGLRRSFLNCSKLQKHKSLLFRKGSMYKICNHNLLYHACIPMHPDGSFAGLTVHGKEYKGRTLLDFCDRMCRNGAYGPEGSREQKDGLDFMWFLWCGPGSPLSGKSKMSTFERYFIDEKETHVEPLDPYYALQNQAETAEAIFREFGISDPLAKIINGHVPVKIKKGETPIKAGGRLLVIDGGISRAYQKETGIAGYTLVIDSRQIFLSEHDPFPGVEAVINHNIDMHSRTIPVLDFPNRLMIRDTDEGRRLEIKIQELEMLLAAYRSGLIHSD